MSERRRSTDLLIPFLSVAGDVLAIEGAFLLAYVLRFHTPLVDFLGFPHDDLPPLRSYVGGSLFAIIAWLLLFNARRMYGARRNVVLGEEFLNVARVISLGMLIVMSAGFLYRGFSYSRAVIFLVWAIAILLVTLSRGGILALERSSYRRGKNLQETVLIGSGNEAREVFARLHLHPSFGFQFAGYFADAPATAGSALLKASYLGPLSAAADYIAQNAIERVFIAIGPQGHPDLFELIAACEGLTVEFMMVPDVLELLTSRVKVRELEGIPFLKLKGIPLTSWGRITKRAFDLVVSAFLLVVLSPLLLAIAFLVRVTSPGAVLYSQRRVGLDGREFSMHKFRSMIAGAELLDGQAGVDAPSDPSRGIGARNDPRRTRIGRFLRATSLDELPQLLNVLKGEMSLVGPRPERPHFVQQLKAMVPKYLDRHRVKTGVTGWAQVNGLRGDTSMAERLKYDLYYVENWSLSFDIMILLRTLRAALTIREASDR
jgi:exopolysaccharide biosynthesis polyprenyl glycosylphosphotransferase